MLGSSKSCLMLRWLPIETQQAQGQYVSKEQKKYMKLFKLLHMIPSSLKQNLHDCHAS